MLRLTRRQFEVLALLARGYSVKCVSRELGISAATTKVHTQTLYQRLGVHNSNAALHAAFANGATLGWYRLDAVDGEGK
jgi:DNA-binding NarL/FixJ family response regulator